ncbi:MAG: hypothetical protein Q9P14_02985 [candidate division KSB1 bacterium]|nr:hypothetical protein [candidate division KSB1 bacterium]
MQHFQSVERFKHEADHIRIDLALTFADFAQDFFGDVGDFLEPFESDQTGIAFKGVEGAEYFIQQLVVCWILFELDNLLVELSDVLPSFFEENFDQAILLPHAQSSSPRNAIYTK